MHSIDVRWRHLACILWLLALPVGGAPPAGHPAPNIVILLADDLGFSDLGCFGGEIRTPNLDRLANGGLRFTQFYNTARCWPSRAALLTGYYAQAVRRDGMDGIKGGANGTRPKWARLLPEYLRGLGYRTYHSGKWHLDGPQLAGGFDHSYCLEDHNRNFAPKNHREDDVPLPPVQPGGSYYSTIAIVDHAVRCLQDHASKFPGRPFFSYVAFTAPHFPLQAPAADIALYRERYLAGWDVVRQDRWQRQRSLGIVRCGLSPVERDLGPPYDFPAAFERLGPGESRYPLAWSDLSDTQRSFQSAKMAVHAAMVDRMDQEIGRLLRQLETMQALDPTAIFFLSDNGASAEIMVRGDGHDPQAAPGSAGSYLCLGPGWSSAANTPLRRHKTWVHEGGIATPLIVHWPDGIRARGALRFNPGHLVDLAPTILELAGGVWPRSFEGEPVPAPHGRSLVPAFAQDGSVHHEYLWWLHEDNRALRVGDWKLVSAAKQGHGWELYDLRRDRAETNNLAARRPGKVRELERIWTRHADEFRRLAAPAP